MAKDAKSKKYMKEVSKYAKSPEAVGAAMGRKKLGKKKFQERASAGRKKG